MGRHKAKTPYEEWLREAVQYDTDDSVYDKLRKRDAKIAEEQKNFKAKFELLQEGWLPEGSIDPCLRKAMHCVSGARFGSDTCDR